MTHRKIAHLAIISTVAFVILCGHTSVLAQDAHAVIMEAKSKLTEGQNQNNSEAILEAQVLLERVKNDPVNGTLAHYYLGLSEYRLAGLLPDGKGQLKHIDKCIEHLEMVVEKDDTFEEGFALLGSALGWKSSLKPLRVMFLGPKAVRMVNKAKELAPENPRVVLIEAISDYNTPKMFGGDPERAMNNFQKATSLFENQTPTDPLMPTWGHEEAYAWIGLAFAAKGSTTNARTAYEKALEINPNYAWVKSVLLPDLEETKSR